MIPGFDPDRKSYFQPCGNYESGFGSSKRSNRNTSRPEVVDHDVGVVVGLEEPVGLVEVILVDVLERLLRLAPQAVSARRI